MTVPAGGMNKIASKVLRQRMSAELREMLRSIPVKGLKESQVGNHVYLGHGHVEVGGRRTPAQVRVWIRDGGLMAGVSTSDGRVQVYEPFTTKEERKAFPAAVKNGMRLLLN